MKSYKLGRKKDNRDHLVKNLTTSLLAYERIVTTLQKAKLTQRNAERIISTILKKDDLNGFKYALSELGQKKVAKKLIEVIKKQYANSGGGYTRILKIGNRKGDNAKMVILELTKKIEASTTEEAKKLINKTEPQSAKLIVNKKSVNIHPTQ